MPPVAVDLDQLVAFTQGDPALERELAALYLKTAAEYAATLRLAGADGARFHDAAHALKGASANLGAGAVAALAAEAERGGPPAFRPAELEAALADVAAFFRARHRLPSAGDPGPSGGPSGS